MACLRMHASVEECTPFAELGHPDVAYKIAGKIFAFLCVPDGPSCLHEEASNLLVLKCDPDVAVDLRDSHPGVIEPAWHWNKKYWNQIRYDKLSEKVVTGLIADSFSLVVAKLTKKAKSELAL